MTELFNKFISWIVAFLIACGIVPSCTIERNAGIISSNIYSGLLNGDLTPYLSSDIDNYDEILSLISNDADGGSFFSDLDYSVNTSGSWRPRIHVQRVYRLAECYAQSSSTDEKQILAEAISSLTDYWLKNDYQSVNWWYNEIAMPNLLGQIAILAKDALTETQLNGIIGLIGRGCLTVNSDTKDLTGTNATDVSVATVYYGVLTKDSRSLRKAVNTLSSELKYSGYEGLQRDGTFFQHGKRLYIGEYGFSFIKNYAKILYILNGSDYSFTEKQLEPLSRFIVNGVKFTSYGSALDPTVTGRGFSRAEPDSPASLVPYLRQLSGFDNMPEKEQIAKIADDIESDTKAEYGLHYFDDAAFLVIHNPDFYFSFRGGKRDLYYSESLNGENILSYNASFPGVTSIMGSGTEYSKIAPLLDYSGIPGTTAINETDDQLKAHDDFTKRSLSGTYLSAKNEKSAVSAAKTTHEGISMTVSCFATDNAAILLGAGMKNISGKPMTTTINQCMYAGDYSREGNTVIHSGIKYILLEGGDLDVSVEAKTGSYRRNNLSESTEPVSGDVFTVSLPCAGSYAYSVMSENTNAEFKVIVNNDNIQAVLLPNGTVAAVFWSAGSFKYNGRTFASLLPAAYLY